ncbi:MAG: RIP metalloprotease RseP [Candidatus Eisenbacteria bacterium]|uniref:Zinc metalloprotease n=1 Tax=Eiseniibacteriota bacterium TaxID=2212470 RepID=A0A956RPD3_UNCEI|nr:RIP metalloprotease RseP [Candidatus Eisenbacteria bacterium]
MGALQAVLAFIIVIGVVVVVHELGHFLAARAVGIRVERFSIGYPPRLFGKKVGDTDYCISALPLGGYVKMAGMIDESMENPEKITGAPDEFMSKSFLQKALVICAGVIMNFLLAWVIYTGVTLNQGIAETGEPRIDAVQEDGPAATAGLQSGDLVLEVDGKPMATWDELSEVVHASAEKPLQIVWDHEGERKSATVTPEKQKVPIDGDIKEVGLIGISPQVTIRPAGFGESVQNGMIQVQRGLGLGLATIKALVKREAGVKDLGGPVLIAKWSADSAKGGPVALLVFIAFISINIGFLNILPIPVLDGGHLVLVTLEAVARRPIPTKVKIGIQQFGMIGLLVLMAVILFNDMGRVGFWSKISNLF